MPISCGWSAVKVFHQRRRPASLHNQNTFGCLECHFSKSILGGLHHEYRLEKVTAWLRLGNLSESNTAGLAVLAFGELGSGVPGPKTRMWAGTIVMSHPTFQRLPNVCLVSL